jgi:hypothetical protein
MTSNVVLYDIETKLHNDGEEREHEIRAYSATGCCSIILNIEFWYGNLLKTGLIEDRQ